MKTSTCVMNACQNGGQAQPKLNSNRKSKSHESDRDGDGKAQTEAAAAAELFFGFWLFVFVCSEALHFGLWSNGHGVARLSYALRVHVCVCLSDCFDVKAYAKQRGHTHTRTPTQLHFVVHVKRRNLCISSTHESIEIIAN